MIAPDLRIVRAAAGRAETAAEDLAGAAVVAADAGVAVAEADRAGIAAGVLVANFPLRSMRRHVRPRNIRVSRERRKGISQLCCRENRWRSSGSEALRMFPRRLLRRSRTLMMLTQRRALRRVLLSTNRLRMNPKRMETCTKRRTKKRMRERMNP